MFRCFPLWLSRRCPKATAFLHWPARLYSMSAHYLDSAFESSLSYSTSSTFSPHPNANLYAIIGLGNIGSSFIGSRHNIGRDLVTQILREFHHKDFINHKSSPCSYSEKFPIHNHNNNNNNDKQMIFAVPETYMNISGPNIVKFLKSHNIPLSNLILIYDDLDLKFGSIRLRDRGSHGGQNGVRSLMDSLSGMKLKKGSSPIELPFIRVRVGIGRPSSSGHSDAVSWVLSKFSSIERSAIQDIQYRVRLAIESIILEGYDIAGGKFNGDKINPVAIKKKKENPSIVTGTADENKLLSYEKIEKVKKRQKIQQNNNDNNNNSDNNNININNEVEEKFVESDVKPLLSTNVSSLLNSNSTSNPLSNTIPIDKNSINGDNRVKKS